MCWGWMTPRWPSCAMTGWSETKIGVTSAGRQLAAGLASSVFSLNFWNITAP